MFYLVFSNVFMLNKCHNALNVHIYDYVIHLAGLCEFGAKTQRESGNSVNTATTCSNYCIMTFLDTI